MTNKNTSTPSYKTKKSDNEALSINHQKNVRYRLRVKQTKEAEDEIARYTRNTPDKTEQGY